MRNIQLHIQNDADAELVKACQEKNRTAQRTLYERYKNAMYNTALRITGDPDEASEALQESFIDIFEQLGKFRFESTLGAWMKTIVIRKSLRRLKMTRITEPLDVALTFECDQWHDTIDASYLEKAIQSLPKSTKAVFLLIEVEGYKHQEVATILGINEGTSKSQLNYAKKLLQKILYEYYKS